MMKQAFRLVMEENGLIINHLNAECRRMGKPKALNVHDVGDFSPKVPEVVLATLKVRAKRRVYRHYSVLFP